MGKLNGEGRQKSEVDWDKIINWQWDCRWLEWKEGGWREKEKVFIMLSNFDTLVLRPVPVHPSSSSPTDEYWKQIWGSQALFCRLSDLSESSRAHVSLYSTPTDISRAQFHPLGIFPSSFLSHLFIMRIVLSSSSLPVPCVHLTISPSNVYCCLAGRRLGVYMRLITSKLKVSINVM